jgi:hypothetical protein
MRTPFSLTRRELNLRAPQAQAQAPLQLQHPQQQEEEEEEEGGQRPHVGPSRPPVRAEVLVAPPPCWSRVVRAD